jgi:spore maturation protein SpmB
MINGKYIIAVGLIIVLIGTLMYFLGNKFSWIGRLPGDIRIEKENFKLYFPITTLLIISILTNVVIWIFKKFLN